MTLLDADNYTRGFLLDEDLMAGVTQHPETPPTYIAFVLQHTTGEYLGYRAFNVLSEALDSINQIPRPWIFERVGGGCKDGACGKEGGSCNGGNCSIGKCAVGSCST